MEGRAEAQVIAAVPARPPSYYVYAIIDVRTTPPTLLKTKDTRPAARQWIDKRDADPVAQRAMRIRRGRLTLF
jgi:hypothetical protein